jgi:chemotaxis regulatin CheY-phosphate phosphatase CheZ
LSIEIEGSVLEKACREMIETIFVCLPNAFKGTIYRVGKMPDLVVKRITSGRIDEYRENIEWGLPAKSGYNPPGKPWMEYRDEPGRPLEAMGWCVEWQKSWTAEDPSNDSRSVRLQMESELEDFQHMEPVLVRKRDLNLDMYSSFEYPQNYFGNTIWNDSDYVVVAVIKIHFRPYTIKMNSHETRVIKKLSRSLGTELLSHQLKQDSMKAMQDLSRDRLNACNILADSLRNAIAKSGLIFSLVKQEIGSLRKRWEELLLNTLEGKNPRASGMKKLNSILSSIKDDHGEIADQLQNSQDRFLELSLTPSQGENWVEMQIEEKWEELLKNESLDDDARDKVRQGIDELKRSLRFGRDPEITGKYKKISEELKAEWVSLIYEDIENINEPMLNRLIELLSNTDLGIPSRDKSRKALTQLKALAETMSQLEQNTNFLLQHVLNGNGKKDINEKIDDFLKRMDGSPLPDIAEVIESRMEEK